MLQLQDGEEAAFESLMELYTPLVRATVLELTSSPSIVDDIVQEVFLRVLKARDRYVPSAKLNTWLSLIARNLVFNLKRNERARRTYSVDFQDSALAESEYIWGRSSIIGPEAASMASETSHTVSEAIARLNVRHREAINLVYFCGKSYAETAIEMDTTPKAVKAMLVRARGRLREFLNTATIR